MFFLCCENKDADKTVQLICVLVFSYGNMTLLIYDICCRKSAIDFFFPLQSIKFKFNICLWCYHCQKTKVN